VIRPYCSWTGAQALRHSRIIELSNRTVLSAPGRRYCSVMVQSTSNGQPPRGANRPSQPSEAPFSLFSGWVLPLLQILLLNARALEPSLVVGTLGSSGLERVRSTRGPSSWSTLSQTLFDLQSPDGGRGLVQVSRHLNRHSRDSLPY